LALLRIGRPRNLAHLLLHPLYVVTQLLTTCESLY
jgi:hypothetical protein